MKGEHVTGEERKGEQVTGEERKGEQVTGEKRKGEQVTGEERRASNRKRDRGGNVKIEGQGRAHEKHMV